MRLLLLVLGLVLIALKLVGAAPLSWWLVTAPIWGPVALDILIVALSLLLRRIDAWIDRCIGS